MGWFQITVQSSSSFFLDRLIQLRIKQMRALILWLIDVGAIADVTSYYAANG